MATDQSKAEAGRSVGRSVLEKLVSVQRYCSQLELQRAAADCCNELQVCGLQSGSRCVKVGKNKVSMKVVTSIKTGSTERKVSDIVVNKLLAADSPATVL